MSWDHLGDLITPAEQRQLDRITLATDQPGSAYERVTRYLAEQLAAERQRAIDAEAHAVRLVQHQRTLASEHEDQVAAAYRRGHQHGDEAVSALARVWRVVADAGRRKTLPVQAVQAALEPPTAATTDGAEQ